MPKKKPLDKRSKSYGERIVGSRDPIQRFLIVCEGKKTEPNYFREFRVPTRPKIVGPGFNTISLVREAIRLRDEDDYGYDQTWCVFDRDSFPAEDFNNAIFTAKANDIQVAYSNEAFELWYVLHFHFLSTGLSRYDYIERLNELLGYKYEKNSHTIYDSLIDKQDVAIRNAQKLLELYEPSRPERDKPSTTVHLLVQELNRFTR